MNVLIKIESKSVTLILSGPNKPSIFSKKESKKILFPKSKRNIPILNIRNGYLVWLAKVSSLFPDSSLQLILGIQ